MKVLGFALDVLVIALVWYVAAGRHDAPPKEERLVAAAVAAKRLSAGTMLDAADLSVELKRVAGDGKVIADPSTAVGWHLTRNVEPGEVLMETMISLTSPFDRPHQRCVLLALPAVGGVWRGTLPQRGETARVWLPGEPRNPVVQYARVLGVSDANTEEPYIQLEVMPATADRISALAKADSKFWVTAAPMPAPAMKDTRPQPRRGPAVPAEPPCEQPPAN